MSIKKLDDDKNIFSRLKEVRKSEGLSQTEFAKKIGLKQSSYNEIETGKREPSEPIITAISYRFKIEEEWLKYGTGEKEAKFEVTKIYEPEPKKPKTPLVAAIFGIVESMTPEEQQALLDQMTGRTTSSPSKEKS